MKTAVSPATIPSTSPTLLFSFGSIAAVKINIATMNIPVPSTAGKELPVSCRRCRSAYAKNVAANVPIETTTITGNGQIFVGEASLLIFLQAIY